MVKEQYCFIILYFLGIKELGFVDELLDSLSLFIYLGGMSSDSMMICGCIVYEYFVEFCLFLFNFLGVSYKSFVYFDLMYNY